MSRIAARLAFVCLGWGALLLEGRMVVHAQEAERPRPQPALSEATQAAQAGSVDVRVLDLDLVNQEGESVKFKSDVVNDKLVVMNFIYTRCTTACPILSLTFTRLQNMLGARLGKEVMLVSISVDPNTDISSRLKEYARKHHAGPGWVFLTGDKSSITKVLSGLGVSISRISDHPVMILVGDGRLGVWTRHYGFPSPEQILARLDELRLARQGPGVGPTGDE